MILAINTAFMTANLALCLPDGKVLKRELDANCKHSENVLRVVDELCQQANIDILQVETVAVVTGPGSFTGLRIGTAIAKALGCANEKMKFLALSSLELMAYNVVKKGSCKEKFVCVLNALSDLFFVAYFDENGIKLNEEKMIDLSEFEKIAEKKFSLQGDLDDAGTSSICVGSDDLIEFAIKKEKEGGFCKLEDLVPKYLRLSQAEDALLKKNKKN